MTSNCAAPLKLRKGIVDLRLVDEAQARLDAAAALHNDLPEIYAYARVAVSPLSVVFHGPQENTRLGEWMNTARLRNLPERVALRIVACLLQTLLTLQSRGWCHAFVEPAAVDVFVPALAIAARAENPPGHKSAGLSTLDDSEAFRLHGVRVGHFPLLRHFFLSGSDFAKAFPLVAPEVKTGREVTGAADSWSIGQLLQHLTSQSSAPLSVHAQQFVAECLKEDPAQRSTLAELATHVALRGCEWGAGDTSIRTGPQLSLSALVETLRRRKLALDDSPTARASATHVDPRAKQLQNPKSAADASSSESAESSSESSDDDDGSDEEEEDDTDVDDEDDSDA